MDSLDVCPLCSDFCFTFFVPADASETVQAVYISDSPTFCSPVWQEESDVGRNFVCHCCADCMAVCPMLADAVEYGLSPGHTVKRKPWLIIKVQSL